MIPDWLREELDRREALIASGEMKVYPLAEFEAWLMRLGEPDEPTEH